MILSRTTHIQVVSLDPYHMVSIRWLRDIGKYLTKAGGLMATPHDLCSHTRWQQSSPAETHLRAVGSSLDDAVDKLAAVALGKDAFWVEA